MSGVTEGLAAFICKHFGTETKCADELGVSQRTIRNWKTSNPRGILKHGPEIVRGKNVTWTQLAGEVLYQEEMLNR